MRTKPTLLAPAALLLAALGLPDVAGASEAPKFADLPSGKMPVPPPPKQKPASIPAREQVPGLYVVSQKFGADTPVSARHVTVVGDAKAAERIKSGAGFGPQDSRGACLMESPARFGAFDPEHRPEWDGNQSWQVNLWMKTKDNPEAGVAAVHVERLVDQNGTVALESIDAWVDPSTRGARLIGRSTLPLKLVGSAIGGVKVYAARDRSDAGERVQFVVARDMQTFSGHMATMMALRQDGRSSHGSGCGHLRVSVAAGENGGESAVVLAPVILPPLPRTKDGDAPEGDTAKEPAGKEAASAAAPTVDAKKIVAILGGKGARAPKPLRAPARSEEKEVRMRDMQIHVSLSKTSRDKEPVLAVSFGWASREQMQRVFEPVEE
jgi:hypothetical protein